ncbi:DUF6282 family protein [Streptomyces cyanogenus]|uniref:Amidohydrolase-related domain-containing protein n=1 Tax=Streptomyces cyanogenus TaxID=80860 RepID=A0ABX7U494_STRCY|nr:DUF6282 family protein [Streptomyces cyanogenus]QTE01850.1 hypothetical protein S1361_31255 [Streptomyces cyanogenus]
MLEPAGRVVVDVHYHAGPDLYRRRLTSAGAGRAYAEAGGWVVLKSHLTSTAARAWEAREEGLPVSGTLVLNELAGGVRPRAVEQAVYAHGPDSPARLVVHLPTLTGPAHTSALRRTPFHPLLDTGRWRASGVLDADGRLRPDVREVLRAARDLPVAVATGHCDREAALRVVDEAVRLGVPRLLLTHATHPMSGFTPDDLTDLREVPGLYVEITALTLLLGHRDAGHLGQVVRAHPRVVFSSDLGQPDQPGVKEWLGLSAQWFRAAQLTGPEIAAVTRTNPANLLAP